MAPVACACGGSVARGAGAGWHGPDVACRCGDRTLSFTFALKPKRLPAEVADRRLLERVTLTAMFSTSAGNSSLAMGRVGTYGQQQLWRVAARSKCSNELSHSRSKKPSLQGSAWAFRRLSTLQSASRTQALITRSDRIQKAMNSRYSRVYARGYSPHQTRKLSGIIQPLRFTRCLGSYVSKPRDQKMIKYLQPTQRDKNTSENKTKLGKVKSHSLIKCIQSLFIL